MTMVVGTCYSYLPRKKSLDAIEFLLLKLILMVQLFDSKHALWLRGTLKPKAWTILTLFPILLR